MSFLTVCPICLTPCQLHPKDGFPLQDGYQNQPRLRASYYISTERERASLNNQKKAWASSGQIILSHMPMSKPILGKWNGVSLSVMNKTGPSLDIGQVTTLIIVLGSRP